MESINIYPLLDVILALGLPIIFAWLARTASKYVGVLSTEKDQQAFSSMMYRASQYAVEQFRDADGKITVDMKPGMVSTIVKYAVETSPEMIRRLNGDRHALTQRAELEASRQIAMHAVDQNANVGHAV